MGEVIAFNPARKLLIESIAALNESMSRHGLPEPTNGAEEQMMADVEAAHEAWVSAFAAYIEQVNRFRMTVGLEPLCREN
ncbi:hypothetical protein [Azonexus hydrophilus]|uniref:hypothetical protein n=1 Tax=Azonexus hydrophilus TaxID=418702 RepID=UPI0019662DC0|nr:hypothetical protein [Azonexus hydrophilus]